MAGNEEIELEIEESEGAELEVEENEGIELNIAEQIIYGDKNYVYVQPSAQSVWNITHNLGKRPSITVIDSAGSVVQGEYEILDINTIRLTFSAPFAGKAILN